MPYFPSELFDDAGNYLDAYSAQVRAALSSVDHNAMRQAAACLEDAVRKGATIYVGGNGGSASIANHLACDHMKGVQTDTALKPIVHSLTANIEIVTAIANDIAYDQIFSFQLQSLAKKGDVFVAISSSGQSPNIVKSVQWARDNGLISIAMTGFDGGEAKRNADIALHVKAHNYGVVEDVHQSLMHILAQFLRQKNIDPFLIGTRKF